MAGRLARSDSRESVFSNASCVSGVGEWQIGDRVRLDNKIGTLAYVGHTKFAPGEWIGLVLDSADGKNNGTVQGVAYFTCADNHGIFCKSSKLERISHSAALGSPMREVSSHSAEFGFDLGDRVMVSGGKIGYLRYLGVAEFAEGVWCGVELDQPLGKNDGTVQGKRYFACKPLHGIFAPAKKTEKAPKLDTPSKIRVHHNKTSMLRAQQKSGSHESLNSIGASSVSSRLTTGGPVKRSVARTANATTNESLVKALQDTIQEKDKHLEQMMNERDLERNEIAEVTMRCEELERRLASGEGGAPVVDEENARRMEKLEQERKALKITLIEKEKIIEDLQFRLEEEEIMSHDRQSKAKELQEKLAVASTVEAVNTFDSVSLEEKNAELAVMREELQKMTADKNKLDAEKIGSEKMIQDMKTTLEETEERRRKLEMDIEKAMAELEEGSVKNGSLVKSLEDETQKVTQLMSEKALMEKENADSRKEMESLRSTMEAMKASSCALCEELRIKKEELAARCESLKNAFEALQLNQTKGEEERVMELKRWEETRVGLEKEREERDVKISALTQSMEEREQRCKGTQEALDHEKKSAEETKVQLDQVNAALASAQTQVKESEAAATSVKAELTKTATELETLTAKVEELKKEIEKTIGEKEEAKMEIVKLTESLADLSTKSGAEGSANEELRGRMEKMREDIAKKEAEAKKMEEEAEKTAKAILLLESAAKAAETEKEERQKEIQKMRLEAVETKKEMEEGKKERQKMGTELEGITGERDELTQKIKQMESTLAEAAQKSEEAKKKLEKELESIRDKLARSEEILGGKETELRAAQESLTAINSSMEVAKMSDDERSRELSGVKEELGRERTAADEMKRKAEKLNEELVELKKKVEEDSVERKEEDERREKERDGLRKEKEEVDGELKNMRKREVKEKEEKDQLEEEKKKIEEELKRGQEKTEQILKEKKEVTIKLKESEEEREKMMSDLKKEKEEGGRKGMEMNEWTAKYEEMREEHEKTKKAVQEWEKKDAEWKSQVEKLKEGMEAREKDLEKNKAEASDMTTVIDVLNGKMGELTASLSKMEEDVKIEKRKNEELEEVKRRMEKEKSEGEEMMKKMEVEKTQLEITISSSSKISTQLEEDLKALREEKTVEEETRGKIEKELQGLKEVVGRLEKERDNLRDTISSTTSGSEELLSQLRHVEEEKKKLELESESDKKEREESEKSLKDELEKITEEKNKILNEKKEMEGLLEKNGEKLKEVSAESAKEKEEWTLELNRMKEELAAKEKIVTESAAKLTSLESEMSVEKKERSKLMAEVQLNVGNLEGKSEEAFKKDTQIESLKYEKGVVMSELEKEKGARLALEERLKTMEGEKTRSVGKDTVEGLRVELDAEKSKFDDLLAQKRQAHELFDELERNWRKKEENLAERVDSLSAELEMTKKKSANEQIKELQNEVDLLRSIVAERVKKEEKYKREIDILKSMPLDGTPRKKEKSEIAPRKFCDICDVFDTHDTEDCPTQSMEPLDPSPKKAKVLPPSREYCDSCEEFGHDTSACPTLFASPEAPAKKKKDYTF